MNVDLTGFYQIAISLASHFDSLYYVEIESGDFIKFTPSKLLSAINLPESGTDFFTLATREANKTVHPDDLEQVLTLLNKEAILEALSKKNSYSITCRLILDGKPIHVRHVNLMCEDKKHILCCLENIEAEVQEKAEQKKNLQSAERMARRDELTGIKNKNAFAEQSLILDNRIKEEGKFFQFGIVMCDVNELKMINDTRGHSFGDEAIQRTSRMICDVFKHSPVFRIGGDEFVVILTDHDYKERESLLEILKDESYENKRARSGPVIACGLAVFDADKDKCFSDVFKRADSAMYDNKKEIKTLAPKKEPVRSVTRNSPITPERKRLLDSLFGAMFTMAQDGYVFLDDLKHDYSRWSLALVDAFNVDSEYLYEADKTFAKFVHPEDMPAFNDVILSVLSGNAEVKPLTYRLRRRDGVYITVSFRGFLLNDSEGNADYFGGIIVPQ